MNGNGRVKKCKIDSELISHCVTRVVEIAIRKKDDASLVLTTATVDLSHGRFCKSALSHCQNGEDAVNWLR